jgi:ubiquinone/menaquinone biosynthesis C-methylase UbiE
MKRYILSKSGSDEINIQRRYYSEEAKNYDEMHVNEKDEHYFSLIFLKAIIDFYGVKSILDVGAGTGRVATYLKSNYPDLKIASIEPVKELREVGYKKGLKETELLEGDATKLKYNANEFDMVCEFGVLHHIKNPEIAVREMLRVARIGIFISDSNNFGQGNATSRFVKQIINKIGLWKMVDFIKTKGKGFTLSEGDGLAYSYSVFNNFKLISKTCDMHIINTTPNTGVDPYKTASHVAIVGIKRAWRIHG